MLEVMAFYKKGQYLRLKLEHRMKERVKKAFSGDGKKKTAIDKWLEEKTKTASVDVFIDQPKRPVFNVQVGDALSGRSRS